MSRSKRRIDTDRGSEALIVISERSYLKEVSSNANNIRLSLISGERVLFHTQSIAHFQVLMRAADGVLFRCPGNREGGGEGKDEEFKSPALSLI